MKNRVQIRNDLFNIQKNLMGKLTKLVNYFNISTN